MFSRSVVAALVAAPLVATAFAASCTRTYTVKEGDWCDTISAQHNVSTYQLAAVNPDIDDLCNNLAVGQNLCLGTEGEDCKSTHVVEANDSCEGLYGTYGINATVLYHNNPQLDAACDNLYIGEVVCVANSLVAPAPPSGTVTIAVPTSTKVATTSIAIPTSTEVATTSIAIPTSTEVATSIAVTSVAHSTITSSAPAATETDDDDDDDLPFCDEL
ncbi:hypothetical protein BD309DRAFT_757476 [Dichomitus squalens]|uniref:uncharacterized protein n=1 Tax=Dichomitus squalens (strain LYAD-421) TaxID=732165 RepID=UPI0004410F53|nr:uncharacterized protein DICSQDRAFT_94979 [Dichomitus squalens LYAD-421 SS1]EJF66520.1 hypothetical protein DICSQDRAFT_94979 [Dichomitus squalens LYAD-421 SS1]TBU49721.1 hypothetical protein BD309DRAFT_757476 [Dichomitus squalens]